jgi:hypothetical protein
MTTCDPTPRLATLAVEATALSSTPLDDWSRTRMTAPQFPLPLIARPGRGKGALVTALDVPAFGGWPVVAADPQHEWASLAAQRGGTPVRLSGGPGLVDVLGGRS